MISVNRRFYIYLGLVLLLLSFSLISGLLAPNNPYETQPDFSLAPPSAEHIFGTDSHGRDILSRVMVGSRTTIFAAFFIIVCAGMFGSLVGILSGYYGGRLDAVAMRITDVFQAFPELVLAIAVAGILGGSLSNAIIAILLTTWTQYARLARSAVLSEKEELYVQAAYISGCSDMRILLWHILPNIAGVLVVTASLHVSKIMMGIAGLSFLGLGVKVPEAEWGALISDGQKYLQTAPWVALAPATVMVATMMIFNLFGDAVRDYLDPKSKESQPEI